MTACGNVEPERDVTKLDGIVSQAGTSTNDADGSVNGIWIIFDKEPTEIIATYNNVKIELEKDVIDDYKGDGSGVQAWQYMASFETAVDAEEYNSNPVVINCKVEETTYEFSLTEDLLERIYPELAGL